MSEIIETGDKVRIKVTGEYGVVELSQRGGVTVRTKDGRSYLTSLDVEKLSVVESLADVLDDDD